MPRQKAASHSHPQQSNDSLPAIVKLWIYRLLIPLGGHREFVMGHGFSHDRLADAIGLGHWLDDGKFDFDAKKALAELRQLAQRCEKENANSVMPDSLQKNLNRLATLVGLSSTDCKILAFAVMVNVIELLDNAADALDRVSSVDMYRALSTLLDVPEADIRASLRPEGLLSKSGLLTLQRSGTNSVQGKLELLSHSFADNLFSTDSDPMSLIREVVTLAPAPELSWQDYDHVAESVAVIRTYMEKAVKAQRKGVNVFIYGLPGTGKTQFARVLAAHLGLDLFEIASADEEGDSVSGERRLRALRAAQCFFSNRDSLLVYDEAEDALREHHDLFSSHRGQPRKAWLNRSLEENSVPTLWLTNYGEDVDPAIVRRFDIVIELPIPSRKHRYRILEQYCGTILSQEEISSLSQSDALSPAVAQRAASVASLVADELPEQSAGNIVRNLVNRTLQAQGYKTLDYSNTSALPQLYDPALLNCDSELTTLAQGIKRAGSARLCFYGPPGTGKTAYAQWLAQELDTPLIVKRASDLISMFIGQTEKLIAAAFIQARDEKAVLLIDEVDSFLQDRRQARASWDISMVNEMLTQLESFEGIFIASTNLMDNLDQAVLRRFDLKLRFNYLGTEQAVELTERYCRQLKLGRPTNTELATIATLRNLTPGDFATVGRQHKFSPFNGAKAFVAALLAECDIKEGPAKAIGFIH